MSLNTRFITGPGGAPLGRIEEDVDTDWGYDKMGNLVGTYNHRMDTTSDKNLMIFGQGNLLSALIVQADDKLM